MEIKGTFLIQSGKSNVKGGGTVREAGGRGWRKK